MYSLVTVLMLLLRGSVVDCPSGQKHWPWRASCSEQQKLLWEMEHARKIHQKAWKLRHVFFAFPPLLFDFYNYHWFFYLISPKKNHATRIRERVTK
jgi:hypothetical protein